MNKQLFRFLALAVVMSLLFSACGGAAPEATNATTSETAEPGAPPSSELFPSATPAPTREIATTQITIDGEASDWEQYQAIASDDPQ